MTPADKSINRYVPHIDRISPIDRYIDRFHLFIE